MQQPPQQPERQPSPMELVELLGIFLAVLVRAWACSIYVFTRKQFGRRYFGVSTFLAVPLIGTFGLSVSRTPEEMIPHTVMLWAWVFMMAMHRLAQFRRRPEMEPHSHYDGMPRLCGWLGISEETAKTRAEPALVALIGLGMTFVLPGLGAYVGIGGLMCAADYRRNQDLVRDRVQQLRDAEMEQEAVRRAYDHVYREDY
ncbi:MAG: hypothetical protein MPJ50_19365 [Pirellulales bacterium]|nr:hypothetical protein [Pirellulales bacterium]